MCQLFIHLWSLDVPKIILEWIRGERDKIVPETINQSIPSFLSPTVRDLIPFLLEIPFDLVI